MLSGLLLAASFPKFGHPAFAWIALTPLMVSIAVEAASGRNRRLRVFALGLVASTIYFAGTLYWVFNVMATFGGFPPWVAVAITVLLVVYLSLYPATAGLFIAAAVRRFGVSGLWLTPFFWVTFEWLRSWVAGGFGWAFLGTSQASVTPVVQLASVTGIYGLSLLVALVSTAAAAITLSRRAVHVRAAIGVLVLLAVITAAGSLRVAAGTLVTTGTVLRVGLVQGNIEQNAKWNPAFRDQIVDQYLGLSRQVLGAGAQLVLWPEAATPFFFDADSTLAEPIRRLAAQSRTPFLIGTDDFEKGQNGQANRIYNAAVVVGPDGRSRGTYRKMVLVPFGEYVPFQRLLFFIGPLVEAVSDFTAGTDPFVFEVDGHRISTSICYESIYPWLSRAFVARGSQLLTTITNDAWFGRSSAPYQHFDQGAVRAVEEGRYVVRAANTGISGVVDPYGRVVVTTGLFQPAAVVADVRLLDDRTIYSDIGDVVLWMSLAVTGFALVLFRRRTIPTP